MKKNILFIMTNLGGGGAEKVLVDIINNMNFEKFNISLFLLRKEGVHLKNIDTRVNIFYDAKNLKSIYSKYMQKRFIKYLPRLFYKINIKNKYDIEIAFLEGLPTKVLAYSDNKKSRKISWVHIDLLKKHWTKKIYLNKYEEEKCYNKMDDIVFVSHDAKKSFNSIFKNNKSNNYIVYNPIIDSEIIKRANEDNIKFEKFTIVSVGRLDIQKGYDRLIKVHSRLIKEYDYNLLIIGEGPQREYLENLIMELEVSNSVNLKGFVENPYVYMNAANLFVSSSRTEGYPLVLLEALVLNKMIIATAITGNNEIIKNGENGIICDDSEEGLYKEIKSILEDREIVNFFEDKLKKRKIVPNYKEQILQIEKIISR